MKMMSGDEVNEQGEFVPSRDPLPLKDALDSAAQHALRREKSPSPVPDVIVQHWRIYYADGTTISSKQTTWEAAKSENVVAVVHAINEEPATYELGTPYYWKFDDWIARVWDPTLNLRQTGLVKFGRWASHKLFSGAWLNALGMIATSQEKYESMIQGDSVRSGSVCVNRSVGDREAGTGFALFYDDQTVWTSESGPWEKAPNDGVLCAVYMIVYSGIKQSYAMRRYTYYYWRGHELRNTDDLDEVLSQFPQCKRGLPHFYGKSYRHQAEAIASALHDQLEDVR